MAILVTGGAGYIGGHMALDLLDAGREVVILDDLSTGFAGAAPPEAVFVQGDIGDSALVAKLVRTRGIKTVIHFAAKAIVPDSVADPAGYYDTNTGKTARLLKAAAQGGAKSFIFSSTSSVYGEVGAEPVKESATLRPMSPYGRSKLAAEWLVQDASHAYGLNHAILRYFNVAGADAKGRAGQSTAAATHLIKAASQAALGVRPNLMIYGDDYATPDGTGVRDYIQVNDLASAHSAALAHLESGGESLVMNCGYGRGFSVKEVVEAVRRVSGVAFDAQVAPRRPGDPASVIADCGILRDRLGWRPAYDDLDVIVAQAYAWEQRLAKARAA